jgi:serine/threonine protein kinase
LQVSLASLPQGRSLGKGSFSVVYESKMKNDKKVAIKKLIEPGQLQGQKQLQAEMLSYNEFRSEAAAWVQLDHPNLLRLLGVSFDPFGFVMELCAHGTLADSLPRDNLPLQTRMRMACD